MGRLSPGRPLLFPYNPFSRKPGAGCLCPVAATSCAGGFLASARSSWEAMGWGWGGLCRGTAMPRFASATGSVCGWEIELGRALGMNTPRKTSCEPWPENICNFAISYLGCIFINYEN